MYFTTVTLLSSFLIGYCYAAIPYQSILKPSKTINQIFKDDPSLKTCSNGLINPTFAAFLNECELPMPANNDIDPMNYKSFLCIVYYDLNLRLCSNMRGNESLRERIPQTKEQVNTFLLYLDNSNISNNICSNSQIDVEKLIDNDYQQTKQYVNSFFKTLSNKHGCDRMCFSFDGTLNPLCKVIMWAVSMVQGHQGREDDLQRLDVLKSLKLDNSKPISQPAQTSNISQQSSHEVPDIHENKVNQQSQTGPQQPPQKEDYTSSLDQTDQQSQIPQHLNISLAQTNQQAQLGQEIQSQKNLTDQGAPRIQSSQLVPQHEVPKISSGTQVAHQPSPVANENSEVGVHPAVPLGGEKKNPDELPPKSQVTNKQKEQPENKNSPPLSKPSKVDTVHHEPAEVYEGSKDNTNVDDEDLDSNADLGGDGENPAVGGGNEEDVLGPSVDQEQDQQADKQDFKEEGAQGVAGGAAPQENPTIEAENRITLTGEFIATEDSHFFPYFLFSSGILIFGYVLFHNKNKVMGLLLEGRKNENRRRCPGGGPAYRKLDCTLEEVVNSAPPSHTPHIVY